MKHVANFDYWREIVDLMVKVEGPLQEMLIEYKRYYQQVCDLIEKYPCVNIPVAPDRGRQTQQEVFQNIIKHLPELTENFKRYDTTIAADLRNKEQEVMKYGAMMDEYIQAIGKGGINIGSNNIKNTIEQIRKKHGSKIEVLRSIVMSEVTEVVQNEWNALKAQGKEMTPEDLYRMIDEKLGGSVSFDEMMLLYLALLYKKPIKDGIGWTTFGKICASDYPEANIRDEEGFINFAGRYMNSETNIKLGNAKSTINVITPTLTNIELTNVITFLEIGLGIDASLIHIQHQNQDMSIDINLLYANIGTDATIDSQGIEAKTGAIIGIVKGEIMSESLHLPNSTWEVDVTLEGYLGAYGYEAHAAATPEEGYQLSMGITNIAGGKVTGEIKDKGRDYNEQDWFKGF